jgi:hypothetical protein
MHPTVGISAEVLQDAAESLVTLLQAGNPELLDLGCCDDAIGELTPGSDVDRGTVAVSTHSTSGGIELGVGR